MTAQSIRKNNPKTIVLIILAGLLLLVAAGDKVCGVSKPLKIKLFIGEKKHLPGKRTTHPRIESKGPIIVEAGWGYMKVQHGADTTVRGKDGTKADAILSPKGQESWNWKVRHLQTSHRQGISVHCIQYLIQQMRAQKATVLILTTGYHSAIYTHSAKVIMHRVKQAIKKANQRAGDAPKIKQVEVYMLNTQDGIEKYNKLVAEGKRVIMAAHLTC